MNINFDSAWHVLNSKAWFELTEKVREEFGMERAHESYIEVQGMKLPLFPGQTKCKYKVEYK